MSALHFVTQAYGEMFNMTRKGQEIYSEAKQELAELECKAAAWDALTVTLKEYHPVLEHGAVSGKWHVTLPDDAYTTAGDDPAEVVMEAVEKMKGE